MLVRPLLMFPWGKISVYREVHEDTGESTDTEKPLSTEINFFHRAVILISPSMIFKQLSKFVVFSFFSIALSDVRRLFCEVQGKYF